MEDLEKTRLFETLPLPRAVATLALPTILSSLVMVLYNLADTYFVGMLGDPVQNAAVTLASPVLLAFNAVNNLFGTGSSSMMSRAMGRKDFETVSRSSAFGFYCALFFSLLFSLLCTVFGAPLLRLLGTDGATAGATSRYLLWTVCFGAAPSILNVVLAYLVRAEGGALHASVGTMSGCLLNMVLDPVFILPGGLDLGAAGAGLATFISNCVACGYFFVLLAVKRGRTYVCISPKKFGFDREVVSGVLGVGLPACLQNLLNVTGMTVLNNFAAGYGADAVAAIGIAQKVDLVPVYIAMGFSQGVMPLIGYNYASGDVRRMKGAFSISLRLLAVFMCLGSACCYFKAEGLIALFMDKPVIVACGAQFLRGACLALPFLCTDFLAVGVFQACGMGKNALVFAVLRKIALEIPALYILNRLFPLKGLGYAQLCAELVLAATALVILARLFKRLEAAPNKKPGGNSEC